MPDNDATTATTPVRKAHADRARLAFEMRLLGGSWSEVAAATGYSNKSNCFNAVKRFMAEVPTWDREQQRVEWRERLLWLWSQACADVEAGRPGAVVAACRVMLAGRCQAGRLGCTERDQGEHPD